MADVRDRIASTPGIAATTTVPAGPERKTQIVATLTDAPDSAPALATVLRLRGAPAGTAALVGGQSAQLTDLHQASVDGHRRIMPLVLAVVLAVLFVLLRGLLLPLLLVAAAWLSLFTAFGAAALVFQLVADSSATEPAVVLFSFVSSSPWAWTTTSSSSTASASKPSTTAQQLACTGPWQPPAASSAPPD
ncbi:MMPL family transporter [Streptomyces nojiriensis]